MCGASCAHCVCLTVVNSCADCSQDLGYGCMVSHRTILMLSLYARRLAPKHSTAQVSTHAQPTQASRSLPARMTHNLWLKFQTSSCAQLRAPGREEQTATEVIRNSYFPEHHDSHCCHRNTLLTAGCRLVADQASYKVQVSMTWRMDGVPSGACAEH
jgi:hypothetical protein